MTDGLRVFKAVFKGIISYGTVGKILLPPTRNISSTP